MTNWTEKALALERLLRLKHYPITYTRLEDAEELKKIPDLKRPGEGIHSFCQLEFLPRVFGWTVGITKDDARKGRLFDRCSRIFGLRTASEKSKLSEATDLATTWMPSVQAGLDQQEDYYRIPAGEAVVLAPLSKIVFEPDVIAVHGNTAQIMLMMCGLQKERYEPFHFSFISEGSCSNSIAQCYVTEKPALAVPCYGERSMGLTADDEIVLALPPREIDRLLSGLRKLADLELTYPIRCHGGRMDFSQTLLERYPSLKKE